MFKNFIQIISGCAAIVIFSNFSFIFEVTYFIQNTVCYIHWISPLRFDNDKNIS